MNQVAIWELAVALWATAYAIGARGFLRVNACVAVAAAMVALATNFV